VGDWSLAIVIYVMGILTGAALTGWSPAFLERWKEKRREREWRHQSREMIELVHREAEKYKKAKDHQAP
jgi:hypothetical protein